MGAQKKSGARVSEDPDELVRVPLQAVLLADSFTTKFRPITLERPKVIFQRSLIFHRNLHFPFLYSFAFAFRGFEGAASARECSDDKLHADLARIRRRRRGFCILLFSLQAGH